MKMKSFYINDNTLTFWVGQSSELQTLIILARIYLALPPSSKTSKREFKVEKKSKLRKSNYYPKNVETLQFLKYNLGTIAYTISMPFLKDSKHQMLKIVVSTLTRTSILIIQMMRYNYYANYTNLLILKIQILL